MSKSDRVLVSREVLETAHRAIVDSRQLLQDAFLQDPFTAGQMEQQALTKLLDIQIALEALCPPQS